MAGPKWLPSSPSSHVLLPEGQAATEGVSANARVPPARFLPAASCCLHVPAASAAAFAGCAVQPERSPSARSELGRREGEALGAAAALPRQEGAGHREAEPAMCRKQGCWEGGGEAASPAKPLQPWQESWCTSLKGFERFSSCFSPPICMDSGICLPFALSGWI